MKKFSWSGITWRTGDEIWDFNKTYFWQYCNDENVRVTNGSNLILNLKNQPKKLIVDKVEYNPKYSLGLVISDEEIDIRNKRFTLTCFLPDGKGLWPAFWMFPISGWTFEVDVFEGYSGNGNYKKNWLHPVNVRNCIHRQVDGKMHNITSMAPWFWQVGASKNYIFGENEYSVEFHKNKIVFLINSVKIRTIDSAEILQKAYADPIFKILINTAVYEKYKNNAVCYYPFVCTKLIIENL